MYTSSRVCRETHSRYHCLQVNRNRHNVCQIVFSKSLYCVVLPRELGQVHKHNFKLKINCSYTTLEEETNC